MPRLLSGSIFADSADGEPRYVELARRHAAEKREIVPDAKYGDLVVAKFMNCIMQHGAKRCSFQENTWRNKMKIWARVRKNNKTTEQDVVEIPQKDASEVENWHEALCELCSKLNLSRPVILDKHVNELLRFSHTVFRPDDFMEQVTFDRLEVELF